MYSVFIGLVSAFDLIKPLGIFCRSADFTAACCSAHGDKFLIYFVILHIEKGCPSYLMEDDDFRIVVFVYVGFFCGVC